MICIIFQLMLPFSRINAPAESGHAYTARTDERVRSIGPEALADDGLPSPLDQPQNTHGKYIPARTRGIPDALEVNAFEMSFLDDNRSSFRQDNLHSAARQAEGLIV